MSLGGSGVGRGSNHTLSQANDEAHVAHGIVVDEGVPLTHWGAIRVAPAFDQGDCLEARRHEPLSDTEPSATASGPDRFAATSDWLHPTPVSVNALRSTRCRRNHQPGNCGQVRRLACQATRLGSARDR